jgi:hypothetical protein
MPVAVADQVAVAVQVPLLVAARSRCQCPVLSRFRLVLELAPPLQFVRRFP